MTGIIAFALAPAYGGLVGARHPNESLAKAGLEVIEDYLLDGERAWLDEQMVWIQVPSRRRIRGRAATLNERMHAALSPGHRLHIATGMASGSTEAASGRAADQAQTSLQAGDHMPRPDLGRRRRPTPPRPSRMWWQVAVTYALVLVLPLLGYQAMGGFGVDLAGRVAIVIASATALMAVLLWVETVLAVRQRPRPVDVPAPPPASAIIAAYLPNEAETVVDTVMACLDQQYRGELQVILAYNTPHPVPVETELKRMSEMFPELEVVRVAGSTSKAENINAVLPAVRGEFVAIYDADHRPEPDSFTRAWERLCQGADVVQGRCVVRNGSDSVVAALVACEFEQIYGVAHPGSARLLGTGIFGGSNGYWRTSLLRRLRMRPSYLTEDIEVSIRAIREGAVIVSDPEILSEELAPVTLPHLWKQRLRWSQGWLQVTCRHLHGVVTSPGLGPHLRVGLVLLLGWRELFPWLSSLMAPTLLFLAVHGRLGQVAFLGLIGLSFTWLSMPFQAATAWAGAADEVKARRGWWLRYLLLLPLYAEWRNVVMRVSMLKELRGEAQWVVTPRTRPATPATSSASAPPLHESDTGLELVGPGLGGI